MADVPMRGNHAGIPGTPRERMRQIADSASGFLYLVSKTGVTGSDGLDASEIALHTEFHSDTVNRTSLSALYDKSFRDRRQFDRTECLC